MNYAAAIGSNLPLSQPVEIPDGQLLVDAAVNIAKVRLICDQVVTNLSATSMDPALITVLSDICEAIRITTGIQEDALKYRSASMKPAAGNLVNLGAIPKKPRNDTMEQPSPSQGKSAPVTAVVSEADIAKQKFIKAVREAERLTLIFNLNMGSVPIMNKDTMAIKATLSLTSMAASVEGKNGSIPSEESVAVIDDVLSLASDMSFFGKATKSYKNSKDPKSGSFCTIPVKYTFNDKDTRKSVR